MNEIIRENYIELENLLNRKLPIVPLLVLSNLATIHF